MADIPAHSSGDEMTIEERLGPELVAKMLAALRNARLYDATNQTLANQIGELHGLHPAGTLLLTTQGHLVVSLGSHPEDVRRPVVRLIARSDGTLPSEHTPEIWSPLPQNLQVARVLHPDEFGFEVDRLMAA